MNAPPLSRSPTGERKKISDPPHRLMDPIEAKIAERGFARLKPLHQKIEEFTVAIEPVVAIVEALRTP